MADNSTIEWTDADWPSHLTADERATSALLRVNDARGGTVWAVVDADIWPALTRRAWHLDRNGYVRRSTSEGGVRINLSLHRVVMCCATHDGLIVDHANRCRLDNRRANLRFVTHCENQANRDIPRPGTTAKPNWHKRDRRWDVRFQHGPRDSNGRNVRHYVGSFRTYEEAAEALRRAVEEHACG